MFDVWTLLRKDLRSLLNVRRRLRRESLFKVSFILTFFAGMEAGLFLLFLRGFRFLATLGGAGFMITRRLFSLFYLGMGLMLVVSGILTAYAVYFRARENSYLLVKPFRMDALVGYKLLQSSALGSWAFFFMVLPFAAAYGWHERMGVSFPFWTLCFSIPFLLWCSAVGALAVLLLVRWTPRGRWLGAAGLMLAALVAYLTRLPPGRPDPSADQAAFVLSRSIPGLRAASWPLLPSWWTSEGVLALTRGQWGRGLMFWCVLASNTLLAVHLVRHVGGACFYPALQLASGAAGARIRRRMVLFPGLERLLRFLPGDARAIALKDIRTFFRDPVQWSQALIFFGLLALYFASLRAFRYHTLPEEWRNVIAFLNVFSVASVLCSLSARFVYPQLSLEGQAFWLLGLAPTRPSRILMTKFALALAATLSVSMTLMLVSTRMLQVDPAIRLMAFGLAAAVSLAVSGLSTGLGAVFLDPRQSNPMAIVSGFGGTLNLALSLLFLVLGIVPYGGALHGYFRGRLDLEAMRMAVAAATGWLALLTAIFTVTPLWLGRRSLARHDY